MVAINKECNPFVGPHPLTLSDVIFGREKEIRDLKYLLTAERIVLLHSPSGAGKSSLLHAKGGVLEQMQERFYVWPTTRVNTQPEVPVANRFVWSAIAGLEEKVPEALRLGDLSRLTLQEFVARRARRPDAPKNVLLVFDQFEEVVRLEPQNVEAKREFFRQVGEVLQDPEIWALFVLRDDFLAALDPYRKLIPAHLQNRYRIDLLQTAAAREAIVGPARAGGRTFVDAAVERLVGDLATIQVQQPDGSFVKERGPYVEPMQLQVACRNLWEQMPADDLSIDPEDVEKFGNVTGALAAYYNSRVEHLDTNRERLTRQWVGTKLITADGIRGQVRKGKGQSEGLENEWIGALEAAHLVRAEQRGGAIWFELAHDRLIAPVQASNAAWFEKNLSPLQRRADLWEQQARGEGLLASGSEYSSMATWAAGKELTATERAYLGASERRAKSARRQKVLIAALVLFGLVAAAGVMENRRLLAKAKEDAKAVDKKNVELAQSVEAFQKSEGARQEALQGLESKTQLAIDLAAQAQAATEQAKQSAQTAEFNFGQLQSQRADAAWREGAPEQAWLLNFSMAGKEFFSLGRFLLPERWPNTNSREARRMGYRQVVNPQSMGAAVRAVLPKGVVMTGVNHQNLVMTPLEEERGYVYSECDFFGKRCYSLFKYAEGRRTGFAPKFDGQFAVAIRPGGNPLLAGDNWVLQLDYAAKETALQAEPGVTLVTVAPAAGQGFVTLDTQANVRFGTEKMRWAAPTMQGGWRNSISIGVQPETNRWVALGARGGTVALYEHRRDQLELADSLQVFPDRSDVTQIQFGAPATDLLFVGSAAGEIALVALEPSRKLRLISRMKAHEGAINHLGVIGGELFSAGQDGIVRQIPLKFEWMGIPVNLPELFLRPTSPGQKHVLDQLQLKSRQILGNVDQRDAPALSELRQRYFGYEPPLQAFRLSDGRFRREAEAGRWTWFGGNEQLSLRESAATNATELLLKEENGWTFRIPRPGTKTGGRVGLAHSNKFVELGWMNPSEGSGRELSYEGVLLSRVSGTEWQLTAGVQTMPPDTLLQSVNEKEVMQFIDATRFNTIHVPRSGGPVEIKTWNGPTVVSTFGRLTATPFMNIPAPRVFQAEGRTIRYQDLKLNGKGNVIAVRPGERVRMMVRWDSVVDANATVPCPNCIFQYYAGFWNDKTQSGFSRCLVSAVMPPGQYQGNSGLLFHDFVAPKEPGLHWITHSEFAGYKCEDIPHRHAGGPNNAIAAILVNNDGN